MKGIPYSLYEARKASNQLKDEYHKELMLWLCDRVELLEQVIIENNIKEAYRSKQND